MFRRNVAGIPSDQGKGGTRWRRRDLVEHWAPVVLWLTFIFLMSTGTFSAENTATVVGAVLDFFFPGLSLHVVEIVHAIVRKAAHVTEYFVLGLLLFRAFRAPGEGWKRQYALFAMVGVILWALGDEFHQSFVATRTASLVDVGIDTAGGILGQLAIAAWYRRFRTEGERRHDEKSHPMADTDAGKKSLVATIEMAFLGLAVLLALWLRFFA